MPGAARRRLHNLKVGAVALVNDGDNPPARFVLAKAREQQQPPPGRAGSRYMTFRDLLAYARKALGREPSEAVRKQLYDEVRQRQQASVVYDALMSRLSALSESLQSIIWWPSEGETRDTETLIRESVQQFAASIETDAAALLAGRIAKLRERWPQAPPDPEELEAALRAELEKLQPTTAGEPRTPEEEPVKKLSEILAGLPDADRAVVKAALDESAAKVTEQAAEITKLKAASTEPPDPYAGLPTAVRKELEEGKAERAAMAKQLADLKVAGEREAFAKGLVFKALPGTPSEVADLIYDVPQEKRTKLVALLKAADAAAAQGGVLSTLGTDRGDPASGALAKIEAIATELRKSNPALSIEKARTRAMQENPDLYEEAEAERRSRLQGGVH